VVCFASKLLLLVVWKLIGIVFIALQMLILRGRDGISRPASAAHCITQEQGTSEGAGKIISSLGTAADMAEGSARLDRIQNWEQGKEMVAKGQTRGHVFTEAAKKEAKEVSAFLRSIEKIAKFIGTSLDVYQLLGSLWEGILTIIKDGVIIVSKAAAFIVNAIGLIAKPTPIGLLINFGGWIADITESYKHLDKLQGPIPVPNEMRKTLTNMFGK